METIQININHNILNQIQEGIHILRTKRSLRENLLIDIGFEAQMYLVRNMQMISPYMDRNFNNASRDPEGLQLFGVNIRRGYDSKSIVIFDKKNYNIDPYKITIKFS